MNILHLVNGNIISDNGYSQRIKRQENTWKKINNIDVYLYDIISWKFIAKPKARKDNLKRTLEYANAMGYEFKSKQGFPLLLFFYNPDVYFNRCAKMIAYYCNKHNIDFIFAENLMCGYMAYICNAKFKIPYVLDYHGVAPEEFNLSGRSFGKVNYNYYKEIETKTIKNALNIVCVSKRFKEYLVNKFDVSEEKIMIAPSCIEEDKIGFDPVERNSIRQQLGISEDSTVIIYAGGCGYWHCDENIISIFSKLHFNDKNTFLIFLTKSENHARIREFLDRAGVETESYFLKSVTNLEVFKYYYASDYGIIIRFDSLINEVASPTKVIEYMATGLGVISTTNVGDINELPGISFLEDYNNLCSDNYDIDKLSKFINEKYDRKMNLNKCKTFLEAEYTWGSMTKRYVQLFEKMYCSIKY